MKLHELAHAMARRAEREAQRIESGKTPGDAAYQRELADRLFRLAAAQRPIPWPSADD